MKTFCHKKILDDKVGRWLISVNSNKTNSKKDTRCHYPAVEQNLIPLNIRISERQRLNKKKISAHKLGQWCSIKPITIPYENHQNLQTRFFVNKTNRINVRKNEKDSSKRTPRKVKTLVDEQQQQPCTSSHCCNNNDDDSGDVVGLDSSSESSVDTARYILSNRKPYKTKTNTMTIKQFCNNIKDSYPDSKRNNELVSLNKDCRRKCRVLSPAPSSLSSSISEKEVNNKYDGASYNKKKEGHSTLEQNYTTTGNNNFSLRKFREHQQRRHHHHHSLKLFKNNSQYYNRQQQHPNHFNCSVKYPSSKLPQCHRPPMPISPSQSIQQSLPSVSHFQPAAIDEAIHSKEFLSTSSISNRLASSDSKIIDKNKQTKPALPPSSTITTKEYNETASLVTTTTTTKLFNATNLTIIHSSHNRTNDTIITADGKLQLSVELLNEKIGQSLTEKFSSNFNDYHKSCNSNENLLKLNLSANCSPRSEYISRSKHGSIIEIVNQRTNKSV